jgi:hypothetical protein
MNKLGLLITALLMTVSLAIYSHDRNLKGVQAAPPSATWLADQGQLRGVFQRSLFVWQSNVNKIFPNLQKSVIH